MQRACYLYYISEEEFNEHIAIALKYHDIGKVYCKEWKNAKGEPTAEAHYYYHDNVSSYIYLCCSEDDKRHNTVWIAWLIGKHMALFNQTKEQLVKKYDSFAAEQIEIIHKYDLKSEEE